MTDEDRIEELQAEIRALSARVKEAEAEITEIRFRDVPRYERGTIVLVPRKLFGKTRMWPAQIEGVHLDYGSGTFNGGEAWERKLVSYAVCLQRGDGSFGGSTTGFYHSEVMLPPKNAEV